MTLGAAGSAPLSRPGVAVCAAARRAALRAVEARRWRGQQHLAPGEHGDAAAGRGLGSREAAAVGAERERSRGPPAGRRAQDRRRRAQVGQAAHVQPRLAATARPSARCLQGNGWAGRAGSRGRHLLGVGQQAVLGADGMAGEARAGARQEPLLRAPRQARPGSARGPRPVWGPPGCRCLGRGQ